MLNSNVQEHDKYSVHVYVHVYIYFFMLDKNKVFFYTGVLSINVDHRVFSQPNCFYLHYHSIQYMYMYMKYP